MTDMSPEDLDKAGAYFVDLSNRAAIWGDAAPITQDLFLTAASYGNGTDVVNVPQDVLAMKFMQAIVMHEARIARLEHEAGIDVSAMKNTLL